MLPLVMSKFQRFHDVKVKEDVQKSDRTNFAPQELETCPAKKYEV